MSWTEALYICDMNVQTEPRQKKLRIGFLLADRFTLSAFASFVDVIRLAADEADRSRPILCAWSVLADTGNPIKSSCGVYVQPDGRLRHATDFDYVVVVGGLIGENSALSDEATRYLKRAAAAGTKIVGLCTGVFLLYDAELLDGYRCCVSWFHHDEFVARFKAAKPIADQIFVVDRDRLTCSGGHSAAHLAAFLVARHIGEAEANKSLSIMMIDHALSAEQPQPTPQISLQPQDPVVKKALIRMRQTRSSPETMDQLAVRLGTTKRQLERRFRKDLGLTPYRAHLRLRLDEVRRLLTETELTVTDVAYETGFCDAPHLIKAFKSETGQTPADFRRSHQ